MASLLKCYWVERVVAAHPQDLVGHKAEQQTLVYLKLPTAAGSSLNSARAVPKHSSLKQTALRVEGPVSAV